MHACIECNEGAIFALYPAALCLCFFSLFFCAATDVRGAQDRVFEKNFPTADCSAAIATITLQFAHCIFYLYTWNFLIPRRASDCLLREASLIRILVSRPYVIESARIIHIRESPKRRDPTTVRVMNYNV